MRKLIDGATVVFARALTFSREDLKRESGQGAVEYALVVLGIAAVVSVAVAGFATQIQNFMTSAGTKLASYV